jgi:hypothetical protein
MKANKKTIFAIAYIVVALIAYMLFVKHSVSKYEEELAIRTAEWVAKGCDPRWYDYFFFESIYYKNVIWVGCILGIGSPLVLLAVFRVLDKTERKK